MDKLRLYVTRHLELAEADDFFRRRVDAPGVIEFAGLERGLEEMRGHDRDADRVEQRREYSRHRHPHRVVIQRLDLKRLAVDG